jgi:hypothetical protein
LAGALDSTNKPVRTRGPQWVWPARLDSTVVCGFNSSASATDVWEPLKTSFHQRSRLTNQ